MSETTMIIMVSSYAPMVQRKATAMIAITASHAKNKAAKIPRVILNALSISAHLQVSHTQHPLPLLRRVLRCSQRIQRLQHREKPLLCASQRGIATASLALFRACVFAPVSIWTLYILENCVCGYASIIRLFTIQ